MKQVIEKIKRADSVAILTHISEDGDAIGSAFAMSYALRKAGKTTIVYVSGEIENRLKFAGEDYVIYNPETAQIHELCLCLDSADIKRLGDRSEFFEQSPDTANIDHHFTNTLYANANYVEGEASSTGEVLYGVIKELGIEMDAELARYLYIAICSDTGGFKFSNVSSKTMEIAAELIGYNIGHDEIARCLFDTFTIEEIKLKAAVMSTIESYGNGKISIVSVTEEMLRKYGVDEKNCPSVVDIPRSVSGTEIAAALKEFDGEVRVNLRSNVSSDVSKIAANFGGGGHKRASGFRVRNAKIDEVKERLIKYCLLEI